MFCKKKANIDQHFTYVLSVRICFNIDMVMDYVLQGWDSIQSMQIKVALHTFSDETLYICLILNIFIVFTYFYIIFQVPSLYLC